MILLPLNETAASVPNDRGGPAVADRTERLGRVGEHRCVVGSGDGTDLLVVGHLAEQVDRHHRAHPASRRGERR